MMLACNSMPGGLCGYVPTPKDAYLFAQINNGNAISLPLGKEYTYSGEENLEDTLKAMRKKIYTASFSADGLKLYEINKEIFDALNN